MVSTIKRPVLNPGSQVLHYRITSTLGSGGMGTVYRAHDTRLGRDVALKVLHAGDHASDEQRERLLREARAASLLSSSSIASIFDIGEYDGRVFIVMELVEGESLSARLARGALAVRDALDIAAQAADALDEAHQRGIVHRDFKSANLMIDTRGRAKLLDFGLAKVVRPSSSDDIDVTVEQSFETRAGTILGTFGYMAPEQALGKVVDARADLFSLGVVIYEMLSGRLPFDGASAMEVIDRVLNAEPPSLTRTAQAVPPALESIVMKLLAKDPGFRYQSARDAYIDLATLLRQVDSGARPGSTPGLGTAVGPSSAMGFPQAGSSAPAPSSAARTSVAVMTFVNITGESSDEWIGSGIAETVTSDLKGIKGLTVIGRAQVFEAAKSLTPSGDASDQRVVLEVGRRIGAMAMVGGGYQRLGEMLRITAQVVDVASGTVIRQIDDLCAAGAGRSGASRRQREDRRP